MKAYKFDYHGTSHGVVGEHVDGDQRQKGDEDDDFGLQHCHRDDDDARTC